MKKVKFIVAVLVLLTSLSYAETEKTVKSKIKKVTVFPYCAQVYRTGNVYVSTGTTKLVFEGISSYIKPNSLQATGHGNFIILDVQHNTRWIEAKQGETGEVPLNIRKQIKLIEDSLPYLSFDIERLTNKIDILTREKNMILNNVTMKGGGRSDSLPVLKEALIIFKNNLYEINNELIKVKMAEHKLKMKRQEMQVRLNNLKAAVQKMKQPGVSEPAKAIHQVIVSVSAKSPTSGYLTINYLVGNAGWAPAYDLRASGTNKPIKITYKANVFQNTGIDWPGIKLKLSTNNPEQKNVKPVLSIWRLNYFVKKLVGQINPYSNIKQPVRENEQSRPASLDVTEDMVIGGRKTKALSASAYTKTIETMTNVEFDVNLVYSIPSDGKKHLIAIQDGTIPAKFTHFIIPKIDKQAYLIAKMTDWEELNLLPAKANIYFEGTYIGQTDINPQIMEDTMELAFGIDKNIISTRKKIKELEKVKVVGQRKIKTITMEITIRNSKNSTVKAIVEDQIPKSANDDIEVIVEDVGDAEYSKKSGKLTWNLTLKPKEKKTVKFSYTIKYDKDKKIQ